MPAASGLGTPGHMGLPSEPMRPWIAFMFSHSPLPSLKTDYLGTLLGCGHWS